MSDQPMLHLEVALKNRHLEDYFFSQKKVTVGRDVDADVRLDNTGISRRHLEFRLNPEGIWVKDLGSSNGTFLNGDPLFDEEALSSGDVVGVGKFKLSISVESSEESRAVEDVPAPRSGEFEGTTVLDSDELERMIKAMQAEADDDDGDHDPVTYSLPTLDSRSPQAAEEFLSYVQLTSPAFVVGLFLGWIITWLSMR